jgi:hypothetical protein
MFGLYIQCLQCLQCLSCRSADVWERMKGKDNPIKRWKWWEQLTLSDAIISCWAEGIEIIDAAKYLKDSFFEKTSKRLIPALQ